MVIKADMYFNEGIEVFWLVGLFLFFNPLNWVMSSYLDKIFQCCLFAKNSGKYSKENSKEMHKRKTEAYFSMKNKNVIVSV